MKTEISSNQLGSVGISLLTAERFLRSKLRRMLQQGYMLVLTKSLKQILRQALPLRVRKVLRTWWIREAEYPTPKFLSARFVRQAIEKNYNLTVLGVPALVPGGVANATWLTSTREESFFAKIFDPYESPVEAVQGEVDLYEYLIPHGIHVPLVLRTRTGQTVSEVWHVYPMVVMKREELRRVSGETADEAELLRISQDLAKMHHVLKGFPRATKLKRYIEGPDFTREHWETSHLLAATPISNSLTQNELSTIKAIDQKMTEYMRKSYPPEMEEYSVIHGDLALEHAQFLPDGNVYFFDFTNMAWAPIVREIAVFLVQLYTREQESTTLERWEWLRTLSLEGYQSVTRFSEVDLKAVKSMMMRAVIEELTEFDRLTYERDRDACILRRKRGYELAEYLLHQK